MDIRLPNLGEGSDSGTVVTIAVKPGDRIVKDQTLIELENEKAVAAIPSPVDGSVETIYVKPGDKISVGQAILSVAGSAESQKSAPASKAPVDSAGPVREGPIRGEAPASTSPIVRRMAQTLGINLAEVRGSGPGGRISGEDLKHYIGTFGQKSEAAPAPAAVPPVDFAKWGPVRAEALSAFRQTISRRMTHAWTTIPHVTQHDQADVSRLLERRKELAEDYAKRGLRLTVTAILVPMVTAALKKYPVFNASLDAAAGRIIFKDYYRIGIAVDTDAGLMVPVIKDADRLSLEEICRQIEALAQKARQRTISADQLQGGTFTITNLGGIGGGFFTPIINAPESAILGIGKAAAIAPSGPSGAAARWMLPLSLSYDHRIIDGADGARFIKDLVERIEKAEF